MTNTRVAFDKGFIEISDGEMREIQEDGRRILFSEDGYVTDTVLSIDKKHNIALYIDRQLLPNSSIVVCDEAFYRTGSFDEATIPVDKESIKKVILHNVAEFFERHPDLKANLIGVRVPYQLGGTPIEDIKDPSPGMPDLCPSPKDAGNPPSAQRR